MNRMIRPMKSQRTIKEFPKNKSTNDYLKAKYNSKKCVHCKTQNEDRKHIFTCTKAKGNDTIEKAHQRTNETFKRLSQNEITQFPSWHPSPSNMKAITNSNNQELNNLLKNIEQRAETNTELWMPIEIKQILKLLKKKNQQPFKETPIREITTAIFEDHIRALKSLYKKKLHDFHKIPFKELQAIDKT